jgi:hypothetical protein
MSAIKRFWRYWCENIETTKGGFDMSALIVTVILAAGCVLCKLVNFEGPIKGFIANSKFADGCEIAAIIVFSGWCFLWRPFDRHEAQRKTHEMEKQDFFSRLQQTEARVKPVAEPVPPMVEHKDKPVEAASQKQTIKDSLGAYLVQLEDRVLAIKKMTLFEYNKSLKNEEDIESIDLLNEIYFSLDLNLSKAESACFKSRTGISFASINDWGQSAFKADQWQGMIDNLNHYASQLKKIIEKQN